MSVTPKDIEAMTLTILGEARSESFIGQVAVGFVIVNRLEREKYFKQKTLYDVCHQRRQFSMWNDPTDSNLKAVLAIGYGDKRYLLAMDAALTAVTRRMTDPTFGADHYHTVAKPSYAEIWPPGWTEGHMPLITIGAHIFYRLA